MTPELPPPPAERDWTSKVSKFGMMLNDQLGDCTCATAGHMIQVFTAANGHQVDIPDAAILKAYEDVGGYVPGDPSTDNGAVVLDLLNYWRTTGIGGHKILGYAAVDLKNRVHTMQAIDIFGGIYLGASLPESIERQASWHIDLDDDGAGIASLGGHAFSAHSYTRHGTTGVTWANPQDASWAWMDAYVDEAYVVVTEDWADADGAPSGFNRDQLLADMRAVG